MIARLNKVFGFCWSVEEVSSEYLGEWVIKKVRITVRDEKGNEWIKEGYGGHKFMPNIDPSDTHKSAFSKALSKAASLLGVGLYLWGPEEDTEVDLNKSGGTEAGITQYPNQSFAPPHVVPQGGQNIPPQNMPRVQSTVIPRVQERQLLHGLELLKCLRGRHQFNHHHQLHNLLSYRTKAIIWQHRIQCNLHRFLLIFR